MDEDELSKTFTALIKPKLQHASHIGATHMKKHRSNTTGLKERNKDDIKNKGGYELQGEISAYIFAQKRRKKKEGRHDQNFQVFE